MSDTIDAQPHAAAGPHAPGKGRSRFSLVLWIVVLIPAALLAYDFRDVLMAGMHRRKALTHVKPGERITQIERTLNQAGYHTRYYDGPPAMIEVSLLKAMPLLSRTIDKAAPESAVDRWVEFKIAEATHFMLMADPAGVVKVTDTGQPETHHFETGMPPDRRFSY